MQSLKKTSLGEWAILLGTVGGGLLTVIGFIVWLSHVDSRVTVVTDAHAALKADVDKSNSDVVGELRDMNTRLSRMEGKQDAVLKEIRSQ